MRELIRRVRFWVFLNLRFPHKRAELQHDQAIEQSGIVDEVKESRRAITHELADEVFKLDAVMDRLDDKVTDDEEGPSEAG